MILHPDPWSERARQERDIRFLNRATWIVVGCMFGAVGLILLRWMGMI